MTSMEVSRHVEAFKEGNWDVNNVLKSNVVSQSMPNAQNPLDADDFGRFFAGPRNPFKSHHGF